MGREGSRDLEKGLSQRQSERETSGEHVGTQREIVGGEEGWGPLYTLLPPGSHLEAGLGPWEEPMLTIASCLFLLLSSYSETGFHIGQGGLKFGLQQVILNL